jgi:hypothetical protein
VAGFRAAWRATFSVRAPQSAPVHRGQHLDVPGGVEAEPSRDAVLHHLDHLTGGVLGVGGVDEVEVGVLAVGGRLEIGQPAGVDPVGIGDDPALGGLPEHLGQPHHGHHVGTDDVGQYLSGTDRGKLVDVADQDHRGAVPDRLEG